MANIYDAVRFLRPNGGYVVRGENYEDIEFLEAEPFSEEELMDAFDLAQIHFDNEAKEKIDKKQALLDKLGITEEEAKLLLS